MRPIALLVACCLPLTLMPADASTADWGARRTVQDLYKDCKSDGAVGQAACVRYLQGFLDAVRIGGALLSSARVAREDDADALVAMFACSHAAVSWQDVKQAFLRWMERNPTQTRTHAAKPIVADKYLPETVTTLKDLYGRAKLYGCASGLRDALSWLGQCLQNKETSKSIPLVVVLAARRPFHLINSDSNIELNPYMLEFFVPTAFPEGDITPVRPTGLHDTIAPSLLRALSGLPRAMHACPLVMVGAGSLRQASSLVSALQSGYCIQEPTDDLCHAMTPASMIDALSGIVELLEQASEAATAMVSFPEFNAAEKATMQ
ncbi:MAG: Rap1a/Tai family immunity protein [Rhizomicrobium sp.]|nr:Rap1a/Tai family immunity protein [Rhizomicrobium sp.]